MIELNSPKAVGLRISGKVEEADMDKTIVAIKEKLKHTEQVGIYVELESFTGFSFDALIEDLRFGAANFKKFNKKAVESDKQWIGKLANLADKFFPSHEVRAFTPDQKQQAREWVTS